jgi:hypothetical protein
MFGKIKINQQSHSTTCIHFDLYVHNDIYKKSSVTLSCKEYMQQQQNANHCFVNFVSQINTASLTKLSLVSRRGALPLATSTTSWWQSNLKAQRDSFSQLLAPSPQKVWGVAPKQLKSVEGLVFATPLTPSSRKVWGWRQDN